jgi:hypothetical protein
VFPESSNRITRHKKSVNSILKNILDYVPNEETSQYTAEIKVNVCLLLNELFKADPSYKTEAIQFYEPSLQGILYENLGGIVGTQLNQIIHQLLL